MTLLSGVEKVKNIKKKINFKLKKHLFENCKKYLAVQNLRLEHTPSNWNTEKHILHIRSIKKIISGKLAKLSSTFSTKMLKIRQSVSEIFSLQGAKNFVYTFFVGVMSFKNRGIPIGTVHLLYLLINDLNNRIYPSVRSYASLIDIKKIEEYWHLRASQLIQLLRNKKYEKITGINFLDDWANPKYYILKFLKYWQILKIIMTSQIINFFKFLRSTKIRILLTLAYFFLIFNNTSAIIADSLKTTKYLWSDKTSLMDLAVSVPTNLKKYSIFLFLSRLFLICLKKTHISTLNFLVFLNFLNFYWNLILIGHVMGLSRMGFNRGLVFYHLPALEILLFQFLLILSTRERVNPLHYLKLIHNLKKMVRNLILAIFLSNVGNISYISYCILKIFWFACDSWYGYSEFYRLLKNQTALEINSNGIFNFAITKFKKKKKLVKCLPPAAKIGIPLQQVLGPIEITI